MESTENKKDRDLLKMWRLLWSKKKLFYKVWTITFVLSCLWILPQPRYYTCSLSIVPESGDKKEIGNLASLASNFGVSLGNGTSDAIYPQLYPDLFESPAFFINLFDVRVKTLDGEVETDYYTYLNEYQKINIITYPLAWVKKEISKLLDDVSTEDKGEGGKRFNPFKMSKRTTEVLETAQHKIECTYSRTTDVVTITVTDQDPLVAATMADSVKEHIQVFLTDYRTKKARIDFDYYSKLTEEARQSYDEACGRYASYADAHRGTIMESLKVKMDDFENDMQMKYNIYTMMSTHKEDARARIQENTPAFTTLTSATVPVKPAGPKRMIFVATMIFLSTVVTIGYLFRKELKEWF